MKYTTNIPKTCRGL